MFIEYKLNRLQIIYNFIQIKLNMQINRNDLKYYKIFKITINKSEIT